MEKPETAIENRQPGLFPNKVKANVIEALADQEFLERLEELHRGKFQLDIKDSGPYN